MAHVGDVFVPISLEMLPTRPGPAGFTDVRIDVGEFDFCFRDIRVGLLASQ